MIVGESLFGVLNAVGLIVAANRDAPLAVVPAEFRLRYAGRGPAACRAECLALWLAAPAGAHGMTRDLFRSIPASLTVLFWHRKRGSAFPLLWNARRCLLVLYLTKYLLLPGHVEQVLFYAPDQAASTKMITEAAGSAAFSRP